MLTLKIRLQLADAVLAVSELSQHAFNYTDYLVNFHMYVIIIALFLILFSTDQRNCCVKMWWILCSVYFPGQGTPPHGKYGTKSERRQKRGEPSGPCSIDNFVPACWRNFKFDVDSIMAVLWSGSYVRKGLRTVIS